MRITKTQSKNWQKVKLGEVADLNPTVRLKKGKSYSFIPMEIIDGANKHIKPNTKKRFDGGGTKFSEGDVLFARITPCLEHGKVAVAKELEEGVGFGSTEYFIFRGKENITNTDFLYYISKTNKFKQTAINSMVGVSGRQRARIEAIQNYELNLPTTAEQKRIAEILSAFDDKIELNNKINQNLEQMAQAIFKEWFMENQKSRIKNQKSGELIKIISGHPFSSKLYVNDKKSLGVVTIKNVQDGNFITSCDSFIREESVPKNMNQECLLHDGDILLSLTGNVGRVCFVYGGKYLLNQRVAKLKPKNEKDRAFCYFLFRQVSMQNRLINMAKGSAQPNLSPVETGEIELDIPSRKMLDKFSELVSPIYQRLIKNAVENQKLAALRDLLLPKLMSGEIKVKL